MCRWAGGVCPPVNGFQNDRAFNLKNPASYAVRRYKSEKKNQAAALYLKLPLPSRCFRKTETESSDGEVRRIFSHDFLRFITPLTANGIIEVKPLELR